MSPISDGTFGESDRSPTRLLGEVARSPPRFNSVHNAAFALCLSTQPSLTLATMLSAPMSPASAYGSPAPSVSPAPVVSPVPRVSPAPSAYVHHGTSKANHPKPKPVNIFSNDGTFLERFQHMKRVGGDMLLCGGQAD